LQARQRVQSAGPLANVGDGGATGSRATARSSTPSRGHFCSDNHSTAEEEEDEEGEVDPELVEIRSAFAELEAEAKREEVFASSRRWSLMEQHIFERLFRANHMQPIDAFLSRLTKSLPDFTEAELASRVQWFANGEIRQARKRQLLCRWRERRAALRRQTEKAKGEQHGRDLAQAEERRRSVNEERRQQVQEWRRSRAEQEAREAKLAQVAQQEQARCFREQQQARQVLQKEALEVYRARRRTRESVLADQSAAQARPRCSSQEDRQRAAQRSLDALTRRLQAQPPQPLPTPSRGTCRPSALFSTESRLHCGTQSSMLKTRSRSCSATGIVR